MEIRSKLAESALLFLLLILSSPERQWLFEIFVLHAADRSHLSVLVLDPLVVSPALDHVIFSGIHNVFVRLFHGIVFSVETRLALSVVGSPVSQSTGCGIVNEGIKFLEEVGDRAKEAALLFLGK